MGIVSSYSKNTDGFYNVTYKDIDNNEKTENGVYLYTLNNFNENSNKNGLYKYGFYNIKDNTLRYFFKIDKTKKDEEKKKILNQLYFIENDKNPSDTTIKIPDNYCPIVEPDLFRCSIISKFMNSEADDTSKMIGGILIVIGLLLILVALLK